MGATDSPDTLHELLSEALNDRLPDGAEKRCIERVARETGPIPVMKRRQPRSGPRVPPATDPAHEPGTGDE